MGKAEEKSKQYCDFREQCGINDPVMLAEIEGAYYEGYQQAEEDLALTWEDMNRIEIIIKDVYRDYPHGIEVKQFGVEVLKRFKEIKSNKL